MSVEVERPPNQTSFGVFKPDKDPLVIRGAIGNVFDEKMKIPRGNSSIKIKKAAKKLLSDVPEPAQPPPQSHLNLPSPRGLGEKSPRRSRPESKTSSRFGAYSQASFFSRHNPHPSRVRHISGLNGQPICAVHDHDVFPTQRFSIRTPTTREREAIFRAHIPPSALGLNSSAFPINIITGLQNYPYREKAVPRIGLIPVTDTWREELREFCNKAGLIPDVPEPRPPSPRSILPQTKRRTIYSADTGRLIPPPSRAMSRQSSRQGVRGNGYGFGGYQHISAYPDTETLMLEMLCQILQTESVHDVQQWLVSSGDREKSLVLDMIKSAMTTEEEILRQQEVEKEEALAAAAKASRPATVQAASRPNTTVSDRPPTGASFTQRQTSANAQRPGTTEWTKPTRTEPGGAEVLNLERRSPPVSPRKLTSARPLGTPSKAASRKAVHEVTAKSPTMRYTKTPTSAASRIRGALPAIEEAREEIDMQQAAVAS